MKIKFTHVEFEGSDEGAAQVLAMLGRTFGGGTGIQPAIEQRTVEALPAPAAERPVKPSAKPQAAQRATGTIICKEKPGTFSVADIAKIAGSTDASVYNAMRKQKQFGDEWAVTKGLHFRRSSDAPRSEGQGSSQAAFPVAGAGASTGD